MVNQHTYYSQPPRLQTNDHLLNVNLSLHILMCCEVYLVWLEVQTQNKYSSHVIVSMNKLSRSNPCRCTIKNMLLVTKTLPTSKVLGLSPPRWAQSWMGKLLFKPLFLSLSTIIIVVVEHELQQQGPIYVNPCNPLFIASYTKQDSQCKKVSPRASSKTLALYASKCELYLDLSTMK